MRLVVLLCLICISNLIVASDCRRNLSQAYCAEVVRNREIRRLLQELPTNSFAYDQLREHYTQLHPYAWSTVAHECTNQCDKTSIRQSMYNFLCTATGRQTLLRYLSSTGCIEGACMLQACTGATSDVCIMCQLACCVNTCLQNAVRQDNYYLVCHSIGQPDIELGMR